MKSTRRHELQHNQLADTLGHWTENLKPYARLIGGLVVLLVVLVVAYGYVTSKSEEKVTAGWDEYFAAADVNDRAKLTEVAEKYAGTSVAPWARILAADIALSEGSIRVFNNKTDARDLLRQSVDNYQTVFGDVQDDMLKQRALFGLGRAHESLAQLDDLNKARDDYKKLLEGWPNGVYAQSAKDRLADLERNGTKEFYDWFAKHEPPKATGSFGKQPDFSEDSLNGDIKLPSVLDDGKFDGSKSKGSEQMDDLELPDFPPAGESKPDEKPSEPNAPAEENSTEKKD